MSHIVRKIIKSPKIATSSTPFSQGVQVGNTLYVSGNLGLDISGNLVSGGVEVEARQALTNIGYILEEAGISYENVVKCVVLLADIKDFALVNGVYKEFFKTNYPARTCFQVGCLPRNGLVEIEAVAVVGQIIDVPSRL